MQAGHATSCSSAASEPQTTGANDLPVERVRESHFKGASRSECLDFYDLFYSDRRALRPTWYPKISALPNSPNS